MDVGAVLAWSLCGKQGSGRIKCSDDESCVLLCKLAQNWDEILILHFPSQERLHLRRNGGGDAKQSSPGGAMFKVSQVHR